MMDKAERHLNGDPIGLIQEKDQIEEVSVPAVKTHWIKKLIDGVKVMANGLVPLINNIADKVSGLIDMVSKVHFAAPFMLIAAAMFYQTMPFNIIALAWISALSGLSACLLCLVLWFNEARLDYLYKQKWGVFWILASQTVVQILSYQQGFTGGHILGGLATLASYPFYVYFNMKCEDDGLSAK